MRVGELVVVLESDSAFSGAGAPVGHIGKLRAVELEARLHYLVAWTGTHLDHLTTHWWCAKVRPATPEELAKHRLASLEGL